MLERDIELAVLAEGARAASQGAGSAVFVFGEAGIGKSVLAESLRHRLPARGRFLIGYCDDLATRRTLGPLRDLIGNVGNELSQALLEGTDRDRLLTALHGELDRQGRPTLLVIEDVHWADDATLDALRYLLRRIVHLPAMLVLTYRDDELVRDHPLQNLLGLSAGFAWVRRLPLRRLSPEAVRQLCVNTSFDADHLYEVTDGNPFFVAETMSTDDQVSVPTSIVDSVLARVRRLDAASRNILEQLAVVPSELDRTLVDRLVPDAWHLLEEAEQRGLIDVFPTRVAFRHEMTRRAIVDSMPAARRVELNRRVLSALISLDNADLAQIVHHATAAGDLPAVARYAPQAANEAARAGAHREATAHYELALGQRARFSDSDRAELLEKLAIECYTIGVADRAVEAQREAVALRRALGQHRELGVALRWLSRFHWWNGEREPAETAAAEAIDVIEKVGDERLLALALSNRSQLHMLADEAADSIALGERAAVLARRSDDPDLLAHALTNIGSARWVTGDRAGRAELDDGLQTALAAGYTDHALRAYINLASCLIDEYHLAEAAPYVEGGIALADAADHVGFYNHLLLERARLEFYRGDWDAALATADFAQDQSPPLRWGVLTIAGRIAVRRGDRGASELLAQAWKLACDLKELQRTAPVAVALAEQAWLAGDTPRVRPILEQVYVDAVNVGNPAQVAEVGYWLSRVGKPVQPGVGDYPYALAAMGRWREAAVFWRAAGCPYERALSLLESSDDDDLSESLVILQRLGARPLAKVVAARLRRLGMVHVPRGPVATSRRNPAGLTARQLEVIRLLAQGLTNAAIAGQLVVSVRTVDSHVAAIFNKLNATDRTQAVERARDLGAIPR